MKYNVMGNQHETVIGAREGRRGCLATVQQVYMPDLRKSRKKEVQDIEYVLKERYFENICKFRLHSLVQQVRDGALTCDVADWRPRLMAVNQGRGMLEVVSSCRGLHVEIGVSQAEVRHLVHGKAVGQWSECFVCQRGRYVPELEIPGWGHH